MKIVAIGGTGLVGSQVVARLSRAGHEAIAASPANGVNTITGEGLARVLNNAAVVIDVANSPSFEDAAAMEFFETSGSNLLAAEQAAGVRHHIALSVVGTQRLQSSGYFRAKLAQEGLIMRSHIPYTIVRATQFFEFVGGIADFSTRDHVVHLTTAAMQPMASADVAEALADTALDAPLNGITEIAGPECAPLDEFVATWLGHVDDGRKIVVEDDAPYFGMSIDDDSLTPGPGARIMPIRFDQWLATSVARPHTHS
ncbi:SDR family oxidoreductase [Sphingomonas endolithica]|uniref:SDR family oxidoreductase n=1 Tax=Sphingomonas endolithica TaxID=2972485 RepID=UPI0021AE8386|nr:SDR family oxidoreductase [Sphingomonas sp. ZFBP2030]